MFSKNGLTTIKALLIALVAVIAFSILANRDDSSKNTDTGNVAQLPSETQSEAPETETQVATESETETTVNYSTMPEDDFKAQCVELYHDDVFFSDDDLEGKLVKIHLFLEEPYTFTAKSMYDVLTTDFIKENNAQKDYFKCGVKRDSDTISYVGGQLELYFTDNSNLNCRDYHSGQHLTVYGYIAGYSNNTWKGYNQCEIVAQYIDVED